MYTESKKCVTYPICKIAGTSSTHVEKKIIPLSTQLGNSSSLEIMKTSAETALGASGDLRFSIPLGRCSKHPKNINSVSSYGDYTAMLEDDCVELSQDFIKLQEVLKLALQNLKQGQWQNITSAVIKLMHISRIQPELLDSHMPHINRSLCSLLRNTRPQIVRIVCQVAMELYKTVQYTQRPEFDELASALLFKSTHTNKAIQNDAQNALHSMVTHLPPATCIRILASEHGAGHKNPLIRATVSRLLYNIINIIGVECLLTNPNYKDIRRKIFVMCAKFLLDGNNETRNGAKKSLKAMMSHQDFDALFHRDIDKKIIVNIEKQLIFLKYNQTHSI